MERLKVKERFPITQTGLFEALGRRYPEAYPWADETVDVLYIGHSGNKTCAPIVDIVFDEQTHEDNPVDFFADLLHKKFGSSWKHLYQITLAEYDPIENYSMTETETPNITRTTDMETNADGESTASGYGFNSVTAVPNAESGANSNQKVTGTETETGNRQLTRSGNIGVTTSQQMIESEIELWKWAYLDTIFTQTDALITCPLYDY